jgi:hypothetical protein
MVFSSSMASTLSMGKVAPLMMAFRQAGRTLLCFVGVVLLCAGDTTRRKYHGGGGGGGGGEGGGGGASGGGCRILRRVHRLHSAEGKGGSNMWSRARLCRLRGGGMGSPKVTRALICLFRHPDSSLGCLIFALMLADPLARQEDRRACKHFNLLLQ